MNPLDNYPYKQPDQLNHYMRNDGVRLLYGMLLHYFSLEDVRRYLQLEQLYSNGNVVAEKDLVEKIWLYGSMLPTEFVLRFIRHLEPFCIKNNIIASDFLKEAYTKLKNGNDIPGHVFARAVLLTGEMFEKPYDHRRWFIRATQRTMRITARHGLFKIINESVDGNWYHDTVVSTLDDSFSDTFTNWDCDLWMTPKIKYFPLCMNYAPYEEVLSLSDCRKIEHVIPNVLIENNNGIILVNSAPVGRIIKFTDFLINKGIQIEMIPLDCNNLSVVEITDSFFCSQRRRIVLQKGCAYGAPVHLFRISYTRCLKRTEDVMAYFFRKSIAPRPVWNSIKQKHRKLRALLTTHYDFSFHKDENAMFLNGELLVKNIPARMLKKIIDHYLEGNAVFERKVFLNDTSIVLDRNNPSIEIRLKRLLSMIAEHCPLLSITKKDRGMYKIDAQCKITITS